MMIDPVLRMLDAALRDAGRSAPCARADDIGAVCYNKTHLLAMRQPFRLAESAARLRMNHRSARLCGWIAEAAPGWAWLAVTDHACYPGVHLGPAAGAHQWTKPLRQCMDRSVAIAANGAPDGPASNMYRTRGPDPHVRCSVSAATCARGGA